MTARIAAVWFLVRILCAVAIVTAVTAPVLVAATGAAQAQEQRERRGLFDFLFGRSDRRQEVQPETRQPRAATRRNAGSSEGVAQRAAPAVPQVDKSEDARVVLVVGDFMSGGLADGLEQAYAESPDIRVVGRANGSSGFVRDDYYDWPGTIAAIIEEEKPAVVIAMIGSNDRQQLMVDGNRERVRSDAWLAEYTSRVTAFASTVRAAGVPLVWVGMPAFGVSSMSSDMLVFNDIYRATAEEVGGEFIDIWDGFVDEKGDFASVGPDINGQRVRLRGSDGINLTAAGKRKVAFYVERPLEKLLGGTSQQGIARLGPIDPDALRGINPAEIERTVPISLSDPALDGSGELLGRAIGQASTETLGTPVEKLVRDGIAPDGRPGRADDFSAPPYVEIETAGNSDSSAETTATILPVTE